VAALLGGCYSNETTVFPPGLTPLEESTAPAPEAQPGDPYPELMNVVTGSTSDYSWAHGTGYVHAPLAEVWAAMTDPAVCNDPATDSYDVTYDVEPEYQVSFVMHYTMTRVITVNYDITWRFGIVEGDEASPETAVGVYQKTWGIEVLELLTGSIVARRIDDTTTEVEIIEHLRAMQSGTDECKAYIQAYYDQIVAAVHGS
jgi:hypothetical protein